MTPAPSPVGSVGANFHRPPCLHRHGGEKHERCSRIGGASIVSLPSASVRPPIIAVLASTAEEQQDLSLFLGEDLIVWLVLAFGGALLAGNVAAIVRPPQREARKEGDLESAPVARSAVMALIGLVATIWALVSLLA